MQKGDQKDPIKNLSQISMSRRQKLIVRNGTTDCKLKYYHHHYPFLQVSMTRRQELRKSEMEPMTGKLKYYQYHSTVSNQLTLTYHITSIITVF